MLNILSSPKFSCSLDTSQLADKTVRESQLHCYVCVVADCRSLGVARIWGPVETRLRNVQIHFAIHLPRAIAPEESPPQTANCMGWWHQVVAFFSKTSEQEEHESTFQHVKTNYTAAKVLAVWTNVLSPVWLSKWEKCQVRSIPSSDSNSDSYFQLYVIVITNYYYYKLLLLSQYIPHWIRRLSYCRYSSLGNTWLVVSTKQTVE